MRLILTPQTDALDLRSKEQIKAPGDSKLINIWTKNGFKEDTSDRLKMLQIYHLIGWKTGRTEECNTYQNRSADDLNLQYGSKGSSLLISNASTPKNKTTPCVTKTRGNGFTWVLIYIISSSFRKHSII